MVVLGFALGGIVGVGTVLYALLIGPVVQLFLPRLTVRVEKPLPRGSAADAADGLTDSAVDGEREGQDACRTGQA